ncbi:MAG: phospho-sugar mutase [Pseudolysinimonas sp.]|uniref:phospho-sugar mutase n=1 Tax=Pseudolysinimonas sp. TaxID=2680009 RepID=UPI003264DF2F
MALLDDARAWVAQDPDPVTRAELDALIARVSAGDTASLADLTQRFSGRLQFGTAGLRGELGAGPMRMNRVLVAQAAAGLATYLLGREPSPSVVIGYDGRHNSSVFARDSAAILTGAGVAATLLPRPLPTPVLAFAVRELRMSAGIMVTASHNPGRDNGYKVYLGGGDGGSQIVPPADGDIEAEITQAAAVAFSDRRTSNDYSLAPESVVQAYVARTAALASVIQRPESQHLRHVYTAMHGVGRETATAVFAAAGFSAPILVAAQADPDPDFPTVAFPNPEEPGAMDLAFATAQDADADLVIANDPDADRVAVGIPTASGWVRLSGNEIGWLLGWRAARTHTSGTLACSLVSSPALREIARVAGLDFVETLTGFKWISRVPGLIYGYEEALGYLVDPDKVRDKDGISAAVAVLSLFCELRAAGTTLEQHLDEFALTFGAFDSSQISIRVADLADISRAMAKLRAEPPTSIGGVAVASIEDFLTGVDGFPPNDILRIHTVDGGRIIVRPSGTEPKLKCYLDASSADGTATERRAAAAVSVARLEAGMRQLLE